jgi:hypothetical protein
MVAAISMSESPLKQRVGDRWAGTRVVRRRELLPQLRTSPRRFAAATVLAFALSALSKVVMELAGLKIVIRL